MRLLCRRAIHASPPTRWKIRKSHSGSLDNPAVLMFPRIPLTHTSRPALFHVLFLSVRLPFKLSVFPLSSDARQLSPMIPKAPSTRIHLQRDVSRRSREERREPELNPDIWCAAVTCKSGQSPVPLRFQIFKVCLDSRRAVTSSLEDCRYALKRSWRIDRRTMTHVILAV